MPSIVSPVGADQPPDGRQGVFLDKANYLIYYLGIGEHPDSYPGTMQQSISFSEVTDYSLDLKSSGLVLRIKQGNKTTDIVVNENTPTQAIVKASAFKNTHGKSRSRARNSYWKPGEAKLDEQKVTEIRQLWADAVIEHGSPTAASRALAKMYDCSAANVSLIIKRKTWTHV